MATKAQLMAELDVLRQQMASRDDSRDDGAPDEPKPEVEPDADPESDPKSYLSKLLASQGIDETEIDALWSQLTGELGDLTRDKPLLTAVAAFGIGFALGRMSK